MSTRLRGVRQPRRSTRRGLAGWAALAGTALLLVVLPVLAGPPRPRSDAAIVPIRGEISDVMRDSLQRRVDRALADGAKTIVFEMDTPGGLVTSALDICRMIKNLPPEVRSVAWVHHRALSAGAMISVACQKILMSGSSSIGDCAPIMVTLTGELQELPTAERAKAESPVLQEFRDSAARNSYDPVLLRAMVTVGEEVWWIQALTTGERKFVTGTEKKRLIDDAEAGKAEWTLVEKYVDPQSKREVKAEQPVDAANELLTLSQREAVAYGIAAGIAATETDVAEQLELSSAPVRIDISGWEKFVMWLNSPLVRGILFVIVLIGAYVEFQHPGLILPGATAAVALVIFLAAPYAAGLANVWTFILLGIGLVLLAVEILLIPGFGIAGLLGIAVIGIAVIGTFVPAEPVPAPGQTPIFNWPRLPGTWEALQRGVIYVSCSVIVAFVGILLILRYLPQLSIGRQLVAPNPAGDALVPEYPYGTTVRVGEIGIVTGDLRPGGQARFGQEVVDVQSQGEYVEAGRRVQVLRNEGMKIVVRPLPDDGAA